MAEIPHIKPSIPWIRTLSFPACISRSSEDLRGQNAAASPAVGASAGMVGLYYSRKLQHGCRMLYAGSSASFGLGLEDRHVPTFWPLLYRAPSTYVGPTFKHVLGPSLGYLEPQG